MKIELPHKRIAKIVQRKGDPTVWFVNLYEPGFPFRKKVYSKYFISGVEAEQFAESLKYERVSVRHADAGPH